jgi:hypothetical protein
MVVVSVRMPVTRVVGVVGGRCGMGVTAVVVVTVVMGVTMPYVMVIMRVMVRVSHGVKVDQRDRKARPLQPQAAR